MKEGELLKGKVADILSSRRIAINIGKNSGVEQDMEFYVLGEKVIRDPDTHKNLGTYKYVKATVRVDKVEANYSVAISKTASMTVGGTLGALLSSTAPTAEMLSKAETLDRYVAVGDVIVQTHKE